MKRLFFCPVLLFCLFLSAPAGGTPLSVGISAGTLGLGADVGFQINNFLKTRLNANILPLSSLNLGLKDKLGLDSGNLPPGVEELDIDIDTTHYTLGLLLDVHPFGGSFRLSGGIYYINLNLEVTGTPRNSSDIRYGDHTFSSRDFGSLNGEVSWSRFAPYIGLGWGTDQGEDTDFSLDFNLGLLHLSNPRLEIGASGPISRGLMYDPGSNNLVSASSVPGGSEAYRSYLEKQAEVKEEFHDLRKYLHWYPVVSLGFTLRF
ncbi:MAG: hypothetical protein LBQ63_08155 [Deltaproteobacteria bacterium]|jgi:hypothetical protein|nr:hypothetical protein [Deltaproteobacteria bacterium]